jgi:hypothetical protein
MMPTAAQLDFCWQVTRAAMHGANPGFTLKPLVFDQLFYAY